MIPGTSPQEQDKNVLDIVKCQTFSQDGAEFVTIGKLRPVIDRRNSVTHSIIDYSAPRNFSLSPLKSQLLRSRWMSCIRPK